ncbi:aldolase/citrate lyase family protein [Sulfurimonas sp. HSL-1716]|uniref:HpcH/HpaI aldolase/citrate lyase family protein n=1 Tax=Hydrocurvibacter sulfurireducens TaxID=3131937 RepID=UPI0031F9789B
MDETFLRSIEKALKDNDLSALDKLAVPKHRVINKKEDYRSVLMLSAHNFKHFLKIPSLDAECIMINLEDGVSKEQKPFALALCAIFLSYYSECGKKLVVRVNALDEGGYDEITYLNQFKPDAVRVPKIRTAKEVKNVLHLLDDDIELHLSVETCESWANLASLKVNKRVKAFYLGILDLFADMRLPQAQIRRDNPTLVYILSHFLVTCKALRVKPVSFVYQDFKNLEEFRSWLELEKSMGFDAKGCISPSQTALVNEIFQDEALQIERAKVIVRLFEMNRDLGITGFVDEEYGFIDEPIYKGALALLKEKDL